VLLGSAIVAAGRATALAAAKVLNVLAIGGLELLLVPFFQARSGNGAIGVVVAFAASEILMFLAAVLVIPRAALSRAFFADLGRAVLLAAGTLFAAASVPAGAVAVAVAVAALAFVALTVALRLVGRADLEALALAFRRRATAARVPPRLLIRAAMRGDGQVASIPCGGPSTSRRGAPARAEIPASPSRNAAAPRRVHRFARGEVRA